MIFAVLETLKDTEHTSKYLCFAMTLVKRVYCLERFKNPTTAGWFYKLFLTHCYSIGEEGNGS